MTAYLYMMRPEGMDFCKIGVASDLKERRHTLQSMCPFRLKIERALMVESREVALAFESWICANAEDANMHGEWYRGSDHLHDLFDCVAPAVDVTDCFPVSTRTAWKNRGASLERLEFDLLRARACDVLGGSYRVGVYLTGGRDINQQLREHGIKQEWVDRLRQVVAVSA